MLVAACDQRPSQAETQAVEVVKLIITEPNNTNKLNVLSHGRAAVIIELIQKDLPSRIAVEFLQARQQQGIPTHFKASTQKNDDPFQKYIVVSVTQGEPSPPKDNQSHFLVLMQRAFNQDWFVTSVSLRAHTSGLNTTANENNNKEHITFPTPPNSIPGSLKP